MLIYGNAIYYNCLTLYFCDAGQHQVGLVHPAAAHMSHWYGAPHQGFAPPPASHNPYHHHHLAQLNSMVSTLIII